MAMRENRSDAPMLNAAQLRREISARNQTRGEKFAHELSVGDSPSVIYQESEDGHGNFLDASYARILANPAWKQRLAKVYTASRYVPRAADRKRFELECANSSDALLMNVFCYPRVLRSTAVCGLLGIEPGVQPEFGFRPGVPLKSGKADRTEIDMRLGSLLVEAKLTEGDFQRAPLTRLLGYRDFDEVFDPGLLPSTNGVIYSYQLIRGVLAASAGSGSFLVLCDRRRPDLIDRWFAVMRAVMNASLRTQLSVLTWQELSIALPSQLREFVEEKYGIFG